MGTGDLAAGSKTTPREGSPDPTLSETEFRRRFLAKFSDPAFDPIAAELDKVADAAWDAYSHHRKSPHTRMAGAGYADPAYELAFDWIEAEHAVKTAQAEHDEAAARTRLLIINGSPRNEHSCPSEVSKSFRLAGIAREALAPFDVDVELLDLSRVTSEYGRTIHPCKACFSTAAALCHWPCSCYPNYSLGQTDDWMNEIYAMWAAAHGVMIITPVHWYQATSPLKLMIDRLVCADGGNPDPTSTHGKKAAEAKAIELAGWQYPRHLAGRHFSVVVHGDAEGAENVRRGLTDWLSAMGLESSGRLGEIDRYIGYWKPYATSHLDLDEDHAIQAEVRNAALALLKATQAARARPAAVGELPEPRLK